jgi:hypothetical protein
MEAIPYRFLWIGKIRMEKPGKSKGRRCCKLSTRGKQANAKNITGKEL